MGDGYIQVSAKGINNVRRRYEVVFPLLSSSNATTLRTFLMTNSGGQIVTLPVKAGDGLDGNFIIEGWKEELDTPLERRFTVSLVEVF